MGEHSEPMTDIPAPLARPTGIHHVRLTVTDIARSKDFYGRLLGTQPAADFSAQAADPVAHEDPARLFGGCVYSVGDQLLFAGHSSERRALESTLIVDSIAAYTLFDRRIPSSWLWRRLAKADVEKVEDQERDKAPSARR